MRELWALGVIAVLLAGIVALCVYADRPVDHGACLTYQDVPQRVAFLPVSTGKVTTIIPIITAAHTECARWQYPEGRPRP